jgi:Ca-activated chloride channel family protein
MASGASLWPDMQALINLTDYTYAQSWVLWLLLLLPALAAYQLWPRKADHGTLRFSRLADLAKGGRGWRVYGDAAMKSARWLAVALMLVALARPQTHEKIEVEEEGIDIFLALDMSGSMEAYDLSPLEARELLRRGDRPLNRFEVASKVLLKFVESRAHDRLGMVIFGKDAFLDFPLTLDRGTILDLLSARRLGDIDGAGTAIGNALARSTAGLCHQRAKKPLSEGGRRENACTADPKKSRVVILITDGDRQGGDVSPRRAVEVASKMGVKVFTVLVGREGIPPSIPDDEHWSSHSVANFMTNPQLLKEIAASTGGKFYQASDEASLAGDLQDILNQLERTRSEAEIDDIHHEHYLPFASMALLLLCAELGVGLTVFRKFP